MEGEPTTKRELIEELIADADGVDGVAIVDALALSVSELIRTIPVMAEVIEAARALLDSEERFGQPAIALQDALDRLDAPLSQDFINAANAIADADEAPIANWS